MIARVWHGVVSSSNASDYAKYLADFGVKDYESVPGNQGVVLLQRVQGDDVHFLLISYWASREAVQAYAGPNIEEPHGARIHPLMNIPVPWMYVITFLAGIGLQYLVPLAISAADVLLISRIAGMVLIAGGVLLAFSSLGIFRAARTTTVPFETPSKLVTWGPYRFTRNPMYVGLALTYVGVAGIQAQLWPVILLFLLVIYIDKIVVPVEEARLRDVFGDAYEQYCARVRRWI